MRPYSLLFWEPGLCDSDSVLLIPPPLPTPSPTPYSLTHSLTYGAIVEK